MNEEKNKKIRFIVTVIIAVAIAVFSFAGGFITSCLTRKKSVSSFEWALRIINEHYYVNVPSDRVTNSSLKGLVSGCLDIYSAYYTPEEYAQQVASNSGSRSGVGISYTFVTEKDKHPQGKSGILLERVVGGSPAYESGLRAGEFVTGAKDTGGSVNFASSDDFADYIDGKKKDEKFTLITDRGEREMAKKDYTASYTVMSTSTKEWSFYYEGNKRVTDVKDGGISCLPEGAAYLKLDQFYGNAAMETAELVRQFNAEKCDSLILDLRGNGGGSVAVMCDISGIFTGQLQNRNEIAMRAVYKDGSIEKFRVEHKFPSYAQLPAGTKVSVLADNGSASASEALIGVLVDNGVVEYGDIYISDFSESYLNFSGTADKNCRTYGKGIMQTTYVNPVTKEALKLTTAKIYWPKGETSIHGTGLTVSQGCKTVKTDWDVTYGDEQLVSAVVMIYGS